MGRYRYQSKWPEGLLPSYTLHDRPMSFCENRCNKCWTLCCLIIFHKTCRSFLCRKFRKNVHGPPHCDDIIMGAMAPQITSLIIVYSTVYSDADQRKHQSSASLAFCAEKSPGTGEFLAQMASNAENVSIWWRHHAKLYCHWHSQ